MRSVIVLIDSSPGGFLGSQWAECLHMIATAKMVQKYFNQSDHQFLLLDITILQTPSNHLNVNLTNPFNTNNPSSLGCKNLHTKCKWNQQQTFKAQKIKLLERLLPRCLQKKSIQLSQENLCPYHHGSQVVKIKLSFCCTNKKYEPVMDKLN